MAYGNYPDLTNVRRVLVVKLRHLGDVLLTSPVFSALKKALPAAEIDAYVTRESAPMLEGHPAISDILEYDTSWKKLSWLRRLGFEAAMLRRIRNKNYDCIINLTEGDRGALCARFSSASIRVGVDQRKIYTHVVKNCPSLRHTVERNLDALRRIGIFPTSEERELLWTIPEDSRKTAFQKVSWKNFILIHPASRWRFKCWPTKKMAELSRRLIEQGEKLIFTSGSDPHEMAMVEEITLQLPKGSFFDCSGRISLHELGALIERTKALICVDSVPFHMASVLKVPVIALFGPTSEITWGPWRNPLARIVTANMSCRPCYQDGCGGCKVSDCLAAIRVDEVLSEFKILSEIRASGLRIANELVDSPS